jgi:FTR1 family protein
MLRFAPPESGGGEDAGYLIQALIITLREGIEAALVVALVTASLRKAGRQDLFGRVAAGLAAAVAASLLGGLFLRRLAINEEIFEGSVMLVAAVFVASMMWWMHRAGRDLKQKVEARVASVGGRGWAVFWLTFLLVAREGIEAVLFLSATSFSSATFRSIAGGAVGLLIAVILGVGFVQGSARIDLKRFFKVTDFVLGLLLVQLFVGGIHEFAEAGLVPLGPREMALLGPVVKNNVLFALAVLLAPLYLLATAPRPAAQEGSGPEARLRRSTELRSRRGLQLAAGLSVALLLVLAVHFVATERGKRLSPSQPVTLVAGEARIPADLNDGDLRRYEIAVHGNLVRFFAFRVGAEVRTAFDACQICGTEGYNLVGGQLLCLHCDAAISPSTVGREGGCNPIPLPSRREGDSVFLRESDLAAAASAFPKAGSSGSGG